MSGAQAQQQAPERWQRESVHAESSQGCGLKPPCPHEPGCRADSRCMSEDDVTPRLGPTAILYNTQRFTISQRLLADLTTSRSDERIIQVQGAEGACVECGRVQTIWLHYRQIVRGSDKLREG